SITSARHIPTAEIKITTANGKALAIAAVCNALRPPAISNTAATTPSELAQNTRCHTGVFMTPPDAKESITNEPESDEVTKKVMINRTVANDKIAFQGSCSYNLNNAIASSFCTSVISVW